jgi:hypothetical protein
MKRLTAASLAAATLAAWLGLPGVAIAAVDRQAAAVTIHYATRFEPEFGVGESDGTLDLTIARNGIINGTYRPEFGARFIPVIGGRQADHVWLEFGFSGRPRVEATIATSGAISGTTFGSNPLTFEAQPV